IYLTKISKNVDSGFLYVLGAPLKNLTYEWINYYDKQYYDAAYYTIQPNGKELLKRIKKNVKYYQLKISPDCKKAAYVTNDKGKYKIWIYDIEKNKKKKIFKKEFRLDQITDYSYPVLAWHPTGELLAFTTEEKGIIYLNFYLFETGEIHKRELYYFEKVLDFSYSLNGLKMVMSVIQNGYSNIIVYNINANTIEQITNDTAYDLYPGFINNSDEIVFISDRKNNKLPDEQYNVSEIETSRTFDIFVYDYKNKGQILDRITETPYINESKPYEITHHRYAFLSDENGIYNRYLAKYDSAISFIDTSAHYIYYTTSYPVTNYNYNIVEQDLNIKGEKSLENIFYNNKHHLLYDDFLSDKLPSLAEKIKKTTFRKKLTRDYIIHDSILNIKTAEKFTKSGNDTTGAGQGDILFQAPSDTSIIDINNYFFEIEKREIKTVKNIYNRENTDEQEDDFKNPRQRVYFTSFYADYIVNQIDFGFLNSSYQAFTGSAVYFNPGFNILFKLGTKDLFEDYRVTGGFRFAANFDSNEYLLSFENLKKRVDKQLIFHRQSFSNILSIDDVVKTHSHEIMYILKYPFNQVCSFKVTPGLRNDRIVIQSTGNESLKEPNIFKTWAGLKLEFIFDNTRSRGINLYNGTRFKLFTEGFVQIDKDKTDLFVVGADFRHYHKLHRDLIWASRIAASTSFGEAKLIYYLGSVDNWINLSTRVPTFLPLTEVPVNMDENWAYQALATNMRGFSQNIRNGNSFALMNNELRWPVIRYLANRPINSDFLANFQVVGFFDIGSAWSGKSPKDEKNAYNTRIVQNYPITVIIDNERAPFVYGYGFGIRSRVFGYFVRLDWAWGVESGVVQPRMFYLSLSLDF
ncbi:MAG: hypothetical protein HY738_23235, partial [Bacteroidia bacterium]|nr:hypothetical protein [Bacteroidia bacterium]